MTDGPIIFSANNTITGITESAVTALQPYLSPIFMCSYISEHSVS